jgi:putative SOS response-associated peptidase YedK
LGEKSINQSVETLQEKPTLKKTVLRNRCIIPADGWYAWKKIGNKTQVPHRLVATDQNLFSFAGVCEEFEDENGSMLHTFMILTLQANETVSTYAERMPILFDKKMEDVWLDKTASEKELAELLIPYSDSKISAYTVSPRINDPENEHASLILPAPSSDQHGNLTLFD